jgi:hypothetical protein
MLAGLMPAECAVGIKAGRKQIEAEQASRLVLLAASDRSCS